VVRHRLHPALAGGEQLGGCPHVLLRHVDGETLHRFVDLPVNRAGDHLGLADGEFKPFPPHLFHEDRERELSSALHLPRVRPVGGKHPQRAVPEAFALVFFSRPAMGEVFTPIVMEIAGSSTVMGGRGRGSSASVSVSPIMMSSMPATATISPACASSAGTRSSASVRRSSVMRT